MATKVNVEGIEKAAGFYLVPPENLEVDNRVNTRKVSAEDIKAMAASIERQGQQTPIKAYVGDDGKLYVVYGYTRTLAMRALNKKNENQQRKIRVEVVEKMTPAEAYRASVIENFVRANPSPIEIAAQIRTMLDTHGFSEEEVAGMFSKKGNDGLEWVRTIQKLNELPKEIRDLVHARELPVVAAVQLVGLDEKVQKEIIKNAPRVGPEKRIHGETVRKQAREAKRGAATADGEEKKPGRSAKEMRALLEGLTGPGEDKPVKTLAAKLLDYWNGAISYETAERHFRTLGGATKESAGAAKAAKEKPAAAAAETAPAAKKTVKKAAKKTAPKAAPVAAADEEGPIEDLSEAGEPQPELVDA